MLRLPFESEPSLLKMTAEGERQLYQQHFELLQDWNARMALVSRKSIDKSFENHYADSIHISHFAHQFYKEGKVFDLGSGAGFPGIVFAIRYPQIPVVLFERVQKKNKFLCEVVSKLGLKNVEVRGEWLNQKLSGIFLARAVTPRPELFEFFETRISPGSIVILNSGGGSERGPISKGFKLLMEQTYTLPKDAGSRSIEAITKVREREA